MLNDEDILIKIGNRLRELRKAKGYSSYENFALDFDLPRMQYWRLEKGKTNVTIKTLEKILSIHNISFSEFFKFPSNE
jgi:transcriptional regulator with XRE-family HTH domain